MPTSIVSNFINNGYYTSANPINITVTSNNSGNCNFRYVCDIYVNNIKVFSQKLFPDPLTGYGFFQISRVIADYIDTNIPKSPQSTYFALSALSAAPTSLISVYCKFGEEYDSTVDCSGVVNQYLNQSTSNNISVFESAIDYEDFPSFDYNNYTFDLVAKTASFLTNSPRTQEVSYNDTYYLDFISTQSLTSTRLIALQTYDSGGLINSYSLASTTLPNTKRYRVAVGPYDINKIYNSPIINQSVLYYTVSIGYLVGLTYINLTETFRFDVKPPKAFTTRIAFVGLKGGLEHFTFFHRNISRYELERKTYEKTLQRNYSSILKYEVGDRGTTQYATKARERHTVSSYCSRDNSEWLNEMWLSPTVWTYKRPELLPFIAYVETSPDYYSRPGIPAPSGSSRVLFFIKDHGLSVGNQIFCFPDTTDSNNNVLESLFTVSAIVDENTIDCGLTLAVYPALVSPCGWVQKKENWQMLPIVISDNSIEIKQKTSKPVEYTLNYDMAYMKNTLR